MHSLWEFLILLTLGFTASGIVANLYRIAGVAKGTAFGQFLSLIVLTVSGPSEIFESAIHNRVSQQWSTTSFWLVIAMASYWSLVLGLIVIRAAMIF